MIVVRSTSVLRTTAQPRNSGPRWYFASAADNRCSWNGRALLGGSYFPRPGTTIASVTSTPGRDFLAHPHLGTKALSGIRRGNFVFALSEAESGSNVEELFRALSGLSSAEGVSVLARGGNGIGRAPEASAWLPSPDSARLRLRPSSQLLPMRRDLPLVDSSRPG